MSYVGIYPRYFLGKFYERSKNFQCFNCHLISPKNYFIECHHCVCEHCAKKYLFCPLCLNQEITLEGDNPTAFQFTLTEIILNPYEMQCIFSQCPWQGTYQDFIKSHYMVCKYRKNKRLLREYFLELNHDYSNERNKRSKSEIKIVKKSEKNLYLPLNNWKESNYISLDDSSFDNKSNGLNLNDIKIKNSFKENNKINTGIIHNFSYPKKEIKNEHYNYNNDFKNGSNNLLIKKNSFSQNFKNTINVKNEIDNYDDILIPKDILNNNKKENNNKYNNDEIFIRLSDSSEENNSDSDENKEEEELSDKLSIVLDGKDEEENQYEENEENEENENGEEYEMESFEIIDEEEENEDDEENDNENENDDENDNDDEEQVSSYYLRKNDKKRIYEKEEKDESEEIEDDEDEDEDDDNNNNQDEDYEEEEIEEIENEDEESEEEKNKRKKRKEYDYRSKSYDFNLLRKKRNHDNYNYESNKNYSIKKEKNNHFGNYKRYKF